MDARLHDQESAVDDEALARVLRDPARLAALDGYGLLDTPPEPGFDDLVRLAGQFCRAPIALISLVAADRQFFKAQIGLDVRQTVLGESICVLALGQSGVLVFPDLAEDPRTRAIACVAGPPRYRFYAGAPLRTPEGHVLGTLCVIDRSPRPEGLSEAEATALGALARQVMAQVGSRRALAERDSTLRAQRRMVAQQAALIATQDAISRAKGDIDAILDALLAGAMKAVPAAEGGVIEQREGDHLTFRSARGVLKPHVGTQVPLRGSLAGQCLLTAQPLLSADAEADARSGTDLARRLGTRACLLVPVSRDSVVIAVLKLQSSRVGAFTASDLDVVRLFAGAAAAGFAEASDAASRQAAQAAEGRYRAVFESAVDLAIIVTDREGRVTDWNEGAVRTLGWSRAEMLGRPADVILSPADRPTGGAAQATERALPAAHAPDERWHWRKDGRRFWGQCETVTLRSEDGTPLGVLKILRDRTVQHEAEERIVASERRLHLQRGLLEAVVRQAPVGISIAFADGESTLVNDRMTAMLGPKEGSRPPLSLFERRRKPRHAADKAMTRALRFGEDLSNELVRHQDGATGEVRHWMVSCTPVRGDAGEVLAAVSVVVDIEEQRRAMQALQASEERLALAVEASGSLGWWDWDLERRRIYGSALLARAYGLDPLAAADGLSPAAYVACVHPDDRLRVAGGVKAALARGGEFEQDFRLCTGAWVHARGRCYLDEGGKPVRFPGVVVDITARKAGQAEVEAKEAELRTVVEAMPVGVLLAEAPSGRIVMGNRRLERILGHPAVLSADRAGYAAYRAVHADDRPVQPEEWPLARITGGECDHASIEVRYRRPGGDLVWIALSGEAVKDGAGRTVGAVVTVTDIEARKHAEANQALLNHELSHRMKNTLAMVQAVATQTLRNAPDLPAAREAMERRLIALGKAHEILLDGGVDGADVADVIAGALDLHDDRQGRIALRGPAFPVAPSAAMSLSLMIHELATNAVKYGALSTEEGRVAVAWRIEDGSEGERFALDWSENGGPAVAAPTRKGFGSRLIERGFGRAPGSAVTVSYPPGGVVCAFKVPMELFRSKDDRG